MGVTPQYAAARAAAEHRFTVSVYTDQPPCDNQIVRVMFTYEGVEHGSTRKIRTQDSTTIGECVDLSVRDLLKLIDVVLKPKSEFQKL